MKKLYIITLILLTFSSCFNNTNNKKYYEIYYNSAGGKKSIIPKILRVRNFRIDKIYDRYNIVNRTSAYELVYSKSEFWAVKPESMIADLITNQIKKKNMFKNVTTKYDEIPHFVLTGRILALDKIKSEKDVYARVSMELKILDFNTNKVLVSHRFEKRREVINKDMLYVAREISNIIQVEVDKFLDEAYEKLSTL